MQTATEEMTLVDVPVQQQALPAVQQGGMLAANSPLRYVADAWDSFHHLYGIDIQHLRPCIALENNQFESTVGNTFRPINDKLLSRSFHLLKGRLRYIAMNYFDIYAKF